MEFSTLRSRAFLALPLTLLVMTAQAAGLQGPKIPRPIPEMGDLKTFAPPLPATRPSLLAASRAQAAGSPTPVVTTVDDTRREKTMSSAVGTSYGARNRFDHVYVSEPGEGAVWARGRDYKASFDAAGVTYIPFFGSRADTNHPVRFALSGARVGEHELSVDVHAAPRRDADGMVYARGALVERWRWSVGSVEQSFVLAAVPGAGDLVLNVAVATDLAAVPGHGAIRFENALGSVEYGAAIAIDADGRRFPMSSTWNEGSIELRLDHALLASARFPLVVDPVVSTFAVDASFTDDFGPDTAYEAGTDSYIVVEEEAYSATDHDIWAVQLDASGSPIYATFLDSTTTDWRRPRVASNAIAQNFLCVAAVTPVGGGLRSIRGVTFAATTQAVGAQFTISSTESGDKLNPDVGGDPALVGPTYYFVIWQRTFSSSDQDIHGRRVGADGTLSALIPVDNSSNTIDTFPAISKSDGRPPFATQNWTIVWQRFYFGTQEQVWAAQYLWDGTVTHATYAIDTGDTCLRPTVSSILDGDGVTRPYMVSFQVMGQQQTYWHVLATIFEGTQFQTGTSPTQQFTPPNYGNDQRTPCVDSDGEHFTMTWSQFYAGSNGDWDIFVADLVYAAGYPYVCVGDTFAYSTLQELSPRLTSTYSGGGARRRYLAAWDVLDQYTTGATHDVYAALWDGCEGGFATPYCYGDGTGSACPCGNSGATGNGCASSVSPGGANLSSTGNPRIANDSFVLVGTGMPNSAALYFQGTAPVSMLAGTVFGDGLRCVVGFVTRLGTKINVGGASQYPETGDPTISSFTILPSTGTVLYYQVWYRNAAAFCSPSTFNLTNGLRAIWSL